MRVGGCGESSTRLGTQLTDVINLGDILSYRPKPPITYRVESDGLLVGHYDDKQMAEEAAATWSGGSIKPLYL